MANYKMHLLVCGGTGCRASESEKIAENLTAEIKNVGMENDAQVVITGCFGFCEKGPIVKIVPDNTFYTQPARDGASCSSSCLFCSSWRCS